MPAPPFTVANAGQLRIQWSLGTEFAVNVMGIVVGSGTFSQATANAVGVAIKGFFTSSGLAAQCHTGTSLARVGLRDRRAPNLPEYLDTAGPTAGTGVGDPLPTQTALAVTLRTALTGRSFTGRVFLGGFSEASNDASGLTADAAATAARAFVQAIVGTLQTSGGFAGLGVISRPAYRVQVIRRTFDIAPPTEEVISDSDAKGGAINLVTAIETRTTRWETQRRRANGRSSGLALLALNGATTREEVAPASAPEGTRYR
jgi:hypothetical protein